jgi:L-asparaginase/Glu-tRNA(Gln) amidotransferase subunit D
MVVFNDMILKASRVVKVSESDFRAFDTPVYEHL